MAVKVTSASRTSETATDAPATIRVINKEQIESRGYLFLSEILSDIIGFDYSWAADAPNFSRISVRGIFGNNKILILQDGVRISPPSGEVVAIAENFPLYLVEQVEILYGPASALYGADAMTAVINLITHKKVNSSNTLRVRGGQTEFGYADLQLNFNHNDWFFRFGAHGYRQSLDEIVNQNPDNFTLTDLINFAGNILIPAEERQGPILDNQSDGIDLLLTYSTNLSAGYTERRYRHSTGVASRPEFVDYGKKPEWESSLTTQYLKYQTALSPDWTSETLISKSKYELSPQSSFANIFVNFDEGYKYALGKKQDITQVFNWSINPAHQLSIGLLFEDFYSIPLTADLPSPYQTVRSYQNQNLYFPNTNNTLPIPIFNIDWQNYGVFSQLKSKLTNKLTTTLGLRFDESSSYGGSSTPRLGLVYRANDNRTYKVAYGEAFLAPSPQFSFRFFGAFEFQRDDGLFQSFFFQIPNQDLKPEKLKSLEFNWTEFLTDNWLIQADIFANKLDDLIQTSITEIPNSDFIVGGFINTTQVNKNLGTVTSYGIDLSLKYQSQFENGASLDSWLNFSFIDGERKIMSEKTELPFTTQNKVRIGATYNHNHWTVSPSFRWQDKSTLSETGNAQGVMAKGYAVYDLFIERKNVFGQFDIHMNIENIFNQSYVVPGEGSATVFTEVPQLPRWITLGFTFRF